MQVLKNVIFMVPRVTKFVGLWKEISVIGRLENLEVLKLRRIQSFMGLGDRWDTKDGEFE